MLPYLQESTVTRWQEELARVWEGRVDATYSFILREAIGTESITFEHLQHVCALVSGQSCSCRSEYRSMVKPERLASYLVLHSRDEVSHRSRCCSFQLRSWTMFYKNLCPGGFGD